MKKAGAYAKALQERKLYKQVYSLDANSEKLDGKKVAKLEGELSSLAGCDILIDVPQGFFKLFPIDQGSVKFRAVNAAEFYLAADADATASAHAACVDHQGIQ